MPSIMATVTRTVDEDGEERKRTFSRRLLRWYDKNARDLPWRVSPADRAQGVAPDPYRVWLSEIMLQQTTVATVIPRFETFLARWPTIQDLAAAPVEDVLGEWAGLGYYARARNLHKCAGVVTEQFEGRFPCTAQELSSLPGIGPYTSAAIASIAFDEASTVVDGNVDRVIVRQFGVDVPIREAKSEIYEFATSLTPKKRPGDYAQAMMDLGATICRPKSPTCMICPVKETCAAYRHGIADELPKKSPKKERPARKGVVYVGIDGEGRVLTERRPSKGLFGGLAGLPGSVWASELPQEPDPFEASWQDAGTIEHVLTHFRLILTVKVSSVDTAPGDLFWTDDDTTLPTVFRKAVTLAREQLTKSS